MSVNRTRLLFADDTDLLARARTGIVGRPEFDVVMAASTDEALQLAADSPAPGAVVLPADGAIDGMQVCRTVKAKPTGRTVPVLLALPADGSAMRDACFAAGADDVLFAPVEAADIAARLDRNAAGFRSAPRAEVELIVRLASPTGNAVIDAKGTQISREAVQVILPAGMAQPAPGVLVRAVFTLYEGGTLQVWARVAPSSDASRTVLRLVGLTEGERKAIDYFVDFYLKRAGVDAGGNEKAARHAASGNGAGTSAEELLLSAEVPKAPPASPNDTLTRLADASLDEIAAGAALLVAGRPGTLPAGFDAARVRGLLPKLAPAETSALRGTTMYNSILGDLRHSAAAKLKLLEISAVLREAAKSLDKTAAEESVLAAIAEAQQIHAGLDGAFQEMLKAGNTAAMRDLGPVKTGLLGACVDLKSLLDRDVLGKDAGGPQPAKVPTRGGQPTKYTPAPAEPDKPAAAAKPKGEKAAKGAASGTSAGSKRVVFIVLIAGLVGGAIWSNVNLFVPAKPAVFRADIIAFETHGIRVWLVQVDPTTDTVTYVVDGTWGLANEAARTAAVADLIGRSAGHKQMRIVDHRSKELESKFL